MSFKHLLIDAGWAERFGGTLHLSHLVVNQKLGLMKQGAQK